MLLSLLTLAVIGLSLFVLATNVRMVAADMFQSLRSSLGIAFATGRALPNAAFGMLWLLIFGLCFL